MKRNLSGGLGSPPQMDMGSFYYPAHLRTWPTQYLFSDA